MPKTIFARKPINLAQVKPDTKEMKRLFNSQGDAYYVAEELKLSNREWESLTDSLLEDRFCFHRFSEKHLPTTEEGVPFVDLRAAFPRDPERLEPLLCEDGIHPSRLGQKLIFHTLALSARKATA